MSTANVLNSREQRRLDSDRLMHGTSDTAAPLEPIEFDPAMTPPSEVFDCLRVRRRPVVAKRKLTDEQVLEIRRRYASGETQMQVAAAFGVHQTTVSHLVRYTYRDEADGERAA